jgi:hypothetical protein
MKKTIILTLIALIAVGGALWISSKKFNPLAGQSPNELPYRKASSTAYAITATAGSNGVLLFSDSSRQRTMLRRIQNNSGTDIYVFRATTTDHTYIPVTTLNTGIKVAANGGMLVFDNNDPFNGSIIASTTATVTVHVSEASF